MRWCALALLLVGCAAIGEAQFKADLQTWLGASETDLYRGFGRPSGEYPMPNGNRVLVWERNGGVETNSAAGGTAYFASASSVTSARTCRIEFELDHDRVISWRTQGNACR